MLLDTHQLTRHLTAQGKRSWVVSSAVVASIVLLVELAGLLQAFDDYAYDWAARQVARWSPLPAKVLLVYTEHGGTPDDELAELLDSLERLGAAHVAVALPWSAAQLRQFERPGVTIAPLAAADDHVPYDDGDAVETTRKSASEFAAVMALPAPRRGVYRHQVRRVRVAGQERLTLEAAVAAELGIDSDSAPDARIRFRGGPGSLPHLPLRSALSGGLVPELLSGRTVLIGPGGGAEQLGVATPTTNEYQHMPVLEFHGHALNTLLTGRGIATTPALGNWLAYTVAALLTGLCFQCVSARWSGMLYPLFIVLAVGGSSLVLWVTSVWPPLIGLASVVSTTFAQAMVRRSAFAQAGWRQLIHNLYTALRQRRWPTDFFSEREPWSQIVSFVQQTLNLNRLIILELPEGSFHVREVKALHCNLAEIDEKRRDCRRWPYALALDEKRPIALDDQRTFLTRQKGESQYLVPLVFSSTVFGFMAVGVSDNVFADRTELETRLNEFANHIAQLLFRRRHAVSQQEQNTNWLRRLRQSADARLYSELVQATHLLEQRTARLENMFDKSPTAAAIYDVFGRLMMVNTAMSRLLHDRDIVASDLTTIDMIVTLAGVDVHAARNIIRKVITSRGHHSMPIALEEQYRDHMFVVRAMQLDGTDATLGIDADSPFQLQGILCEVVDRGDVMRTHRLRQSITDGLGTTLRNDFATIDMAATLIADQTVSQEQREQCYELIHNRITAALKSLNDFEELMPSDLYSDHSECLPVAPLPLLQETIEKLAERATDHGVEIRLAKTPLVSHAFASATLLPQVLATVFDFVLMDSRDDSVLLVDLDELQTEVVFSFKTDGFGVAFEPQEEHLDYELLRAVPEGESLKEVLDQVQSWGGRITVASEIGTGTSLKLHLRKYR